MRPLSIAGFADGGAGTGQNGGAIRNNEALILEDCHISGSQAENGQCVNEKRDQRAVRARSQ